MPIETTTKADRLTTVTQSNLAKHTGTSKRDIADMMAEAGVELGSNGYNLFAAMLEVVRRKSCASGRQSAMEAKLLADAEWTRVRCMRDAGELVLATDLEAMAARLATMTSNVVDSFGLPRDQRNLLMQQLSLAVDEEFDEDEQETAS